MTRWFDLLSNIYIKKLYIADLTYDNNSITTCSKEQHWRAKIYKMMLYACYLNKHFY